MPRFVGLISSCGNCPNYGYYSGSQNECKLVNQIVDDKGRIASFCPLPHYPSEEIANLELSLKMERDAHPYSFAYMTVAHVARKFGMPMTRRGVLFKLINGTSIAMEFDHITEIKPQGTEIIFVRGGKTYKVLPDIKEPALYEGVVIQGREELSWAKIELAHKPA